MIRTLLTLCWLIASMIWQVPTVAVIIATLGIWTYAEPLDKPDSPTP
jgi:hypothetical protein